MNKERPRPPAGGVSCNWKFDENQESHGFSENKERARLPAGGVNCNWKLDENQKDIALYNIFLRTDFQQGGSATFRNLISDEMQHYDV